MGLAMESRQRPKDRRLILKTGSAFLTRLGWLLLRAASLPAGSASQRKEAASSQRLLCSRFHWPAE